jgi:acyl carrier protein
MNEQRLPGSQHATLKRELKQLIVTVCNKDIDPESITDDEALIGMLSSLGLDSLDVLQVNTALLQRYGVRIEDGKHARRVMKSINALADFVAPGG